MNPRIKEEFLAKEPDPTEPSPHGGPRCWPCRKASGLGRLGVWPRSQAVVGGCQVGQGKVSDGHSNCYVHGLYYMCIHFTFEKKNKLS